ncbi:MAG: MBL fold metallo-hydrolase [Pseudomonadota bacterium]
MALIRTAFAAALLAGTAAPSFAHDQHSHTVARPAPADPQLSVVTIAEGLHVLYGPGGNIGVSSGEDGVVLVDDKFSRNAEEILYRVEQIAGPDAELLFVINTHLHGDHTGSNPEMAEAGALIMAHENVRTRMGTSYENKQFGRTVDAVDASFWPVVTFTDEASLHFNGLTARAIHIPTAHTDGDSIIHFEEANTIHMGDNLFLGMFPFVDVDSGGSMPGMIAAHDAALALSDDDTVIIPGHGLVTDKAGLQAARDQLADILDRVRTRKDAGESLEDIIAADPLADLAELDGFIKRDGIITAAWRSLGGAFG